MPSTETDDLTETRDLVRRIDDLVPRDGAIIRTRIDYGELEARSCTPSTIVVGNRLGYLRLGIAFLKAAFADLSCSYPPLRMDLDLRGIQGLERICYEFERREGLSSPMNEGDAETSFCWNVVPGLVFVLGRCSLFVRRCLNRCGRVPGRWVTGLLESMDLNKQGTTPQFARREAIGVIVVLGVVFPTVLVASWYTAFRLFGWYQQSYAHPRRTVTEAREIVRALGTFHDGQTRYPAKLDTIIGQRPLRKGWNTDEWGRPYLYELADDAQSFRLVSAGNDGIPGTRDDLVFTPGTLTSRGHVNP